LGRGIGHRRSGEYGRHRKSKDRAGYTTLRQGESTGHVSFGHWREQVSDEVRNSGRFGERRHLCLNIPAVKSPGRRGPAKAMG